MKARNGIWNTKSGKKTGRYCNKFQFQFQFSIHINLSIHKETQTQTQQKKKTKNKQKNTKQIMQHTTLWYPYTIRFIFRYAVMLILVFFLQRFTYIFSYFIRITVTLSCICFLNCSHLYKQQLKLRTQNSNQISEIRNQKSNSNCLELNT